MPERSRGVKNGCVGMRRKTKNSVEKTKNSVENASECVGISATTGWSMYTPAASSIGPPDRQLYVTSTHVVLKHGFSNGMVDNCRGQALDPILDYTWQ